MSGWEQNLFGRTLKTVLMTGVLVYSAPLTAAESFKFLAFGDMPYLAKDYALLAEPGLDKVPFPFGVFYGDMKSGGAECTNDLYLKNRDHIFGVTEKPVFAALGDNGWTDCDRFGGDELQKQMEVRAIMYDSAYLPEERITETAAWKVSRAQNYPEMAQWQYDNIKFATFHIVGTNNGRTEIDCHNPNNRLAVEAAALNAVDARDTANLAWLGHVFDEGGNTDSSPDAIVLVIQADVTGDIDTRKYVYAADYETKCPFKRNAPKYSREELAKLVPCNSENRSFCNPYATFLSALKHHAKRFQKPVLLIHGSTHAMCVQRSFLGLDNVTRFNGPGDGVSDLAFVSVEQGADTVKFDFSVHRTGERISTACS